MIEASRRLKRISTATATVLVAVALIAVPATTATGFQPGLPLANPGDLDIAPGALINPNGVLSESIGLGEVLKPIPMKVNDGYMLQDFGMPAPTESTGTWLQRGYWYAQEDVVVFVRNWQSDNMVLAREQTAQTTDVYGRPVAVDGRSLQVRPSHPVFASARFTLGRFMFRDGENRDHFTEVTFLGAGQERQSGMVVSRFGNNLQGPVLLSAGNQSFDGSDVQTFDYTHNMNSLEFNYRVKRRMERDQMVLLPDGNWVRRATDSRTREFIAGMRWLSLNEWLVWEAEGNRNGEMRIRTHNNLLGFQMGFGDYWDFARFSVGYKGKAGVYVNFADMSRDFSLFDGNVAVQPTDSVRVEEETLAFIGETSIVARYHIHQNFSLRVSGELLYVDSLAIAPLQTTFAQQYKVAGLSGHSFYLGMAFGIEGYW